jgi:hypothetical protein
VVRDLRIVLSNPSTNEMVPSPSFLCEFGEHTTQFTMPTGLWFIGLFARVEDGAGRPVPWTVPPPEMHTIVKGDIVNLQEIEVGVNPLVTPADAGSGGADGGMPGDDGGAGTAAVPLPRTGRMVTF